MEDFLGEPPRVSTISLIESKRPSYWIVIVYEGGQISKNSCMLSLVITNSLCLTQQSIRSPSTLAFEKISFIISKYTTPTRFKSFFHVLSLNIAGMQVSSRVSNFITLSMIMIALLQQSLYFKSASTDLKLSEFVRACFEVGFLEAECLVGDICTREHRTKNKNKCIDTKQNTKLDQIQVSSKLSKIA